MISFYGLAWPLDVAFEEEVAPEGFFTGHLCTHCHQRIMDRGYLIGENMYCRNCYRFRFVLQDAYEKEKRKQELRRERAGGDSGRRR